MSKFSNEIESYQSKVIARELKKAGRTRLSKKFKAEILSNPRIKRNLRAKLRRESKKDIYSTREIFNYTLSEKIKPLKEVERREESSQAYTNEFLFGSVIKDLEDVFNNNKIKQLEVIHKDGKKEVFNYFSNGVRAMKDRSGLGSRVNYLFNADIVKFSDSNEPHKLRITIIDEFVS